MNLLLEKKYINRTFGSICFLVALLLYVTSAELDYTMLGELTLYQKISDVIKIVAMILLAICFIHGIKQYSIKKLALFALIGVICAISTYTTKSMAPILLVAFWVNMNNISYEDVFSVYFIVLSSVCIITVFLCLIGVFPNRIHYEGGHALGFTHPNCFGMTQLAILVSYVGLRKEKIKWIEIGIWVALIAVVFAISNSSGTVIASVLVVAFAVYLKRTPSEWEGKALTIIGSVIYPVLTVLCAEASLCADMANPVWQTLNTYLTGRIALNKSGLLNYGIPAFGQYIDWEMPVVDKLSGSIKTYNFVDSALIRIPINYGWIFAVLLLAMFSLAGYRAGKKKQWHLLAGLIVYAIHGIVEASMLIIPFNPVLMCLGMIFFDRDSTKPIGCSENG